MAGIWKNNKLHEFKQDPYKTAKVCLHCGNSIDNPRANHTGAVPDKRSGPRLAKDSSRRARLHRALDCVLDRAAARDDAAKAKCIICGSPAKPGYERCDSCLRDHYAALLLLRRRRN